MSISKYSLKMDKRENIIERQSDIVTKALIELLVDDDLADKENINWKELGEKILSLKDDYNNDIFGFIEGTYAYDSDSLAVMNLAFDRFKKESEDYLELELINEKTYQAMNEFMDNIKNSFKFNKRMNKQKIVSFMTIPEDQGKSVLYNDLHGKNSFLSYKSSDGNSKKLTMSSPHHHDFTSGYSKKVLAKLILDELNKIEDRLKSGDNLASVCKSHQSFQSEDGTYVKRNTREKIRIQLQQFDDKIVISGIYYKQSKGAKSNTDNDVQSEYVTRKEVLKEIRQNSDIDIDECIKAYMDFKADIIRMTYEDDLDKVQAMKKYMIDYAFTKEKDRRLI